MRLRLESRTVGDVLIIQCKGRIVAGNEVSTLDAMVGDSRLKYTDIVLQLDQLEFIDSSGLGALMRLMRDARAKGGDLKLAKVPGHILKTLTMTHLLSQFEVYDSVEEAITAAYLGSRYSRAKTGDERPRVLCVYESSDVCTFLREVLCGAGYNALTTVSLDDARILLKATKANLALISARMQLVYGRPTRQVFQEIEPSVSLLVLEDDFATQDPGEAASKVLSALNSRSPAAAN